MKSCKITLLSWWCFLHLIVCIQAFTMKDKIQLKSNPFHGDPLTDNVFSSLFKGNQEFVPVISKEKSKEVVNFDSLFKTGNLDVALQSTNPPVFSPTEQPTNIEHSVKTLTFDVVVRINHCDGTTVSQSTYSAVKQTISTETGVPLSHIGEGTTIEVLTGRRRLNELADKIVKESLAFAETAVVPSIGRKLVATNTTFIVSFPLFLELADYPAYHGNATKLYDEITSTVINDLEDGSFLRVLKQAAQTFNASQLLVSNITVNEIRFQNFYVFDESLFPSSMPSGSPTLSPTTSPSSAPSIAPSLSDHNCYLQFQATFHADNLGSSTITSGDQQTLLETIADITDISVSSLTYISSDPKYEHNSKWDVHIVVQFLVDLNEFPQFKGNSNQVYGSIKNTLYQSVAEIQGHARIQSLSAFDTQLQANAITWSGADFTSATVKHIRFDSSSKTVLCNLFSPTSQPTSQPTSAPTEGADPDAVEFNAYWGIGQTTTTTLSTEGQTALVQTIADVMDVSAGQIQYVAVTDSLRRKLVTGSHELVVETRITVPIHEFLEFNKNATRIYMYFTALLTESVNDLVFQQLLIRAASRLSATDISNATVFEVQFNPWTLTNPIGIIVSPTVAPTASPNGGGGGGGGSPTASPNGGGGGGGSPTASPNGGGGGGGSPTASPNGGGGGSPTASPNGGGGGGGSPTASPNGGGGGGSPTASPNGGGGGGGSPTASPNGGGGGGGGGGSPTASPNGGGGGGGSPTASPNGGGGGGSPTASPNGGGGGAGSPTASPNGGGSLTSSPTPTGSPALSPTFFPTVQSSALLQFKAVFWIGNLGTTLFNSQDQEALLETIAAVENININDIEYIAIRRIISRRALTPQHELVVVTRLSLNLIDFPSFNNNATALYQNLTQQLINALNSGTLTNLLRQYAAAINATSDAIDASVLQLQFEDLSISNPTVNSVTTVPLSLSTGDLAAIISGATVGIALLAFLVFIGYTRCRANEDLKEGGKGRNASSDSNSDTDHQGSGLSGDFSISESNSDEVSYEDIYSFSGQEFTDPDMIIINIRDTDDVSYRSSGRLIVEKLPVIPADAHTYEAQL